MFDGPAFDANTVDATLRANRVPEKPSALAPTADTAYILRMPAPSVKSENMPKLGENAP
jgi:hypothetical protein